jgi:hypothetical protein
MIKNFFEWIIFTLILGCKSEKQADKEKIKDMSEVELNAYLASLENQVNKDIK